MIFLMSYCARLSIIIVHILVLLITITYVEMDKYRTKKLLFYFFFFDDFIHHACLLFTDYFLDFINLDGNKLLTKADGNFITFSYLCSCFCLITVNSHSALISNFFSKRSSFN